MTRAIISSSIQRIFAVSDHNGRCIFVYHTQSVYNTLCILKFFFVLHQHNKVVKRGCTYIFHICIVVGPDHCGRCMFVYHTQSFYNTLCSVLKFFFVLHQHNKVVKRSRTDIFHTCMFVGPDHCGRCIFVYHT